MIPNMSLEACSGSNWILFDSTSSSDGMLALFCWFFGQQDVVKANFLVSFVSCVCKLD